MPLDSELAIGFDAASPQDPPNVLAAVIRTPGQVSHPPAGLVIGHDLLGEGRASVVDLGAGGLDELTGALLGAGYPGLRCLERPRSSLHVIHLAIVACQAVGHMVQARMWPTDGCRLWPTHVMVHVAGARTRTIPPNRKRAGRRLDSVIPGPDRNEVRL